MCPGTGPIFFFFFKQTQMKSGSPSRTTAAHKTQTKIQAWSSLVFHCRHSSFNPSEAPPWDSRPVSGAVVVHYHLLHRPRSIPTALGPAPLVTNSSAEVRADPLLAVELNTFYGRFECNGAATLPISASGSSRQSSDHVFTVKEDEVRRELRRVNVRKAAGPDGITGRVLRSCADQLAGLFTSIFNESLATSVVPTSFKKSVIIPVPKNSKPSCLNDYRPVALTSTVMEVFERLLKKVFCSSSTHLLLHSCYFGPSSVCLSAK